MTKMVNWNNWNQLEKLTEEFHKKLGKEEYGSMVTKCGITSGMSIENTLDSNKCCSPNMFIDIGANIGAASFYLASIYPDINIHAIEANPYIYEWLCRNIKVNNMEKRITPHFLAIAGVEGEVTFNCARLQGNVGVGRIDRVHENIRYKEKVKSVKLDTFFEDNNIKHVDAIKCDIEGAEFEVFSHFTKWDSVLAYHIEVHDSFDMGFEFVCDKIKKDENYKENFINYIRERVTSPNKRLTPGYLKCR